MLISDIRPTTIEGVKSLAAQYRKQEGIKYSQALDVAAKAANCTNFKNALRILPSIGSRAKKPYILLTIYWCDKDKRYEIGRETLTIALEKPILDICEKLMLKQVRGFGNLRMVAPDHFVCDAIAGSQSFARERLSTAERSLRFMERTGLRPSRDFRKAYPNGQADDQLPDSDHTTDWVDPVSGQFILIDEPYSGVPDEAKRADWSDRTDWRVVKTQWEGMYYPSRCDLYVATDGRTGYDIDALVAKINAMQSPFLEEDWTGESAPSWETFISPMATTPLDQKRARCRGMIYPMPTKTTLPYSYNMGENRRRPAAAMPVDGHTQAGRIIKSILRSAHRPYGVYRRMNSVRSTLEDWMSIEIGRGQLEGPEFFDVYYHEVDDDAPAFERAKSSSGIVDMLGELKHRLQVAYPNCAPLRQQIHKIDMSISLVSKMKTARK
ncbi:DUF5623 domain-containing protein [Sphingomonas yabuuchiae]|uniref:DUF5623 domain-containing protein n=1 Tax=Sphingomonas yabuuchiae TaxID=172044 RepID=A0AA41A213_9SPHN|nr:DUF5623 domain-containing protein [Sphingomonas yabuuchiae]MBB4610952.1 hypothetical protein [Sphingomonas yabuuchiae]MBN3558766.1 DUF5623 domain-containing protein [Sphingomonas yabuuchiae]